ncbi:MAG: YbhB/YbcL family Raf kinase inhibitor-like protein [Gemmatimonadales bacterium]
MRNAPAVIAALLLLGGPAMSNAQQPLPAEPGAAQLAIANLPAKEKALLTVTSPAFKAMGDIPFENTQYRGNVFPGLAWSAAGGGPAGTVSYAIIMQDPDAQMTDGMPWLHWTMVNIPAEVRALAPGMTSPPAGATNGPNYRGLKQPYAGPRTPPGPRHRYHVQVFALDGTLPADGAATYDALIAAMRGHVLASGEVVGLGRAPEEQ